MLFGDMNNPSRAAHIAFILRDDGHVCFQLNNGRYICYMRDDDDDDEDADPPLFTMLDTLQYAMGFTLPGQNAQSLPTSFASLIQLQDQFVTYYVVIINDSDGSVVSYDTQGTLFSMTQVTPLPTAIPINIGDGLDYAWVDFSNMPIPDGTSFRNADFSHSRFPSRIAGLDFTGANLSGASLQGTSLSFKCLFCQADLSNSNLTDASADASDLTLLCDFTGANLTNADLTGAFFSDTLMRNATLANCNLTNANLSNCPLNNATLTNCNLTGTDLTNANLFGANLVGSTFAGTKLSSAFVVGAIFTGDDLTGAVASPLPTFYARPLSPPSGTNPRTNLVNCRLNQSLLGNEWSTLDLTSATILNLSSPLSSQANPLLARYSILKGLNGDNLSHLSLPYAVFDNAILDGVDFSYSDLTNASFIDTSLHRTNLAGAILVGANMTGAQMGSISRLFSLPLTSQTDLQNSTVDAALSGQFLLNGITLSQTAALTSSSENVWRLNDAGNETTYTIRLETNPSDNTKTLAVYINSAGAATLTGAYMPGANLDGANLYEANADSIQFYGSGTGRARLDGFAVLELADFNSSNLSNVDFTDARLFGANLSGAHLFNAKFNRAFLTPTIDGKAANLSRANLQGADFTDAKLYHADLSNAAVAIDVAPPNQPAQGGVYLFSLPYHGDTQTRADYVEELTKAARPEDAKLFTLPLEHDTTTLEEYVAALKADQLAKFKFHFLEQHPPIRLSTSATVSSIADTVWQIVDQPTTYNLWTEVTGQDNQHHDITKLFVAPSLPNLKAAFQQCNVNPLRWQATVTTQVDGKQWFVDNDSQNPANTNTGYVSFIIKSTESGLDVYGTSLRITRLGDNNQSVFDTEPINVTVLTAANLSDDTTCPNQTTLKVNQERGGSWETWMRPILLPIPPRCVPTPNNWCSGT
jgi:uncharacterized protein YjbI with pentapeptide repeats